MVKAKSVGDVMTVAVWTTLGWTFLTIPKIPEFVILITVSFPEEVKLKLARGIVSRI
jgi:hypothetical protein